MAFHITQCPCCNSTFSFSAQLLNAANGKVRCGACLSVFLAEQQLVDSQPAADNSETNDSVFVGRAPEGLMTPLRPLQALEIQLRVRISFFLRQLVRLPKRAHQVSVRTVTRKGHVGEEAPEICPE